MSSIGMPFIDCHTHIGRLPGVVGDLYTAEDLCAIADREGAAFMLASSATATTVSQASGNAEAFEMVARFGDRLGGMLWINPHDPAWREDVPRASERGFRGIKIHPVLDNYVVDRASLDEVFACARENAWPILTHTGVDNAPGSASRYEALIAAYPDVQLVLAHLRLEAIPVAKRHDNVYVDTTHVDAKLVEVGLDVLGASKILFGTDAPAGFDVGREMPRQRARRSYAGIIEDLRARGIPESAMTQILYENARAVFGIR